MKFHTNDIYVCLEIDIRRDSPENYLQTSRTYSRYASCIVKYRYYTRTFIMGSGWLIE